MAGQPDHHASARTVAAELFERGEFGWSRDIEDAIAAGSNATEILRVRFALQGLLRSGGANDDEALAAQTLVVELRRRIGIVHSVRSCRRRDHRVNCEALARLDRHD
jgi:hypothetical protein